MEILVNIIVQILLVLMLILQIIVLIHMLFDMARRRKEDKKFYEDLAKINQEMVKLNREIIDTACEEPQLEEENKSEQQDK